MSATSTTSSSHDEASTISHLESMSLNEGEMQARDLLLIDTLSSYLQIKHPLDILMPVDDKSPIRPHKDNAWSWPKWIEFRDTYKDHTNYAILLQSMCVVDFDNFDLISEFETRFPELKHAPMETTKHGAHFFFLRSELADSAGYFDGARQVKVDGASIKIDFKTRTSIGTAGVIAVSPSGSRKWVRPLYSTTPFRISDALLMAVATPKGKRDPYSQGSTSNSDSRNCEPSQGDTPIGTLRCVVMNLGPSRSIDYETWRDTVFAITNVSRENNYAEAGRELAHSFSSLGGSKYNAESVEQKIDAAMTGSHAHPVGIGSLLRWLGEDLGEDSALYLAIKGDIPRRKDVQSYRVVQNGNESGILIPIGGAVGTVLTKESVETAVTEINRVLGLSMVDETSLQIVKDGDVLRATFKASRNGADPCLTRVELHTNELMLKVDGVDAGYLHQETGISVDYSLAALHTNFDDNMSWTATRPSAGRVCFNSDTNAVINTSNFHRPMSERSAQVCIPGSTNKNRTKLADMKRLQTAHDEAVQGMLQGKLGLGNIFVNVQNLNLIMVSEDDKRQENEDLAMALLNGAPHLLQRLVFVGEDASISSCNGLYYCDPDTNIWARKHNVRIHQLIQREFEKITGLSKADRKYVRDIRGQDAMRQVLAGKLGNEAFERNLDTNHDIFACENGGFDSSDRDDTPFFRNIRVEDMVSTTTGWAYDPQAAKAHRADLELFLEQVLPVPEERRVILTFIACLLRGRREEKKLVILTDHRDGHNGKSAFAKLILSFFGKLGMRNTPFVCKGSFDKDRSSHDAALGPCKGKRLIVADELKHDMTLDVAMFKEKAGGGTDVAGRAFGSTSQYDYTWTAGFVLIFNEFDCPKLDAADTAFIERTIVGPMRSKFTDEVSDEPYTYLEKSGMDDKYKLWRSSLADILLDAMHQDRMLLKHLPASMKEWRRGVTQGANPVVEWLDERVEVTGVKADYILLATVESWRADYTVTHNRVPISATDFKKLSKAYFIGQTGVDFKTQAYIGGVKMNALFTGVAIKLDVDD